MPDLFGNPLPGENPLANLSPSDAAQAQALGLIPPAQQAPVGTPMSPADIQREQALVAERPDTNIDPYGLLPQAGAQQAPVAPSAQQAQPTQFVSAPQAKQQDISALLAPVGSIGTGSSTTVSSTNLGKAGQQAAQARDAADQQTLDAGALKQAIAQEKADATAQSAVARGLAANQADAAIAQHTAQLQKDAAEGVAGIKRASDDYERASAELSPDHFWQVQSTGQKIGNLLAIALSGLGSAFSAKAGIQARNGALDLINAAIDRDVDMQKTALQAKERGIRTKESLYQTIRQQGADDLTAMAATKAAALGKVERELDVKIAAADTKEAAANGAALRAAVGAQRAQELQRVAELTATRVQSTAGSRPVSGLEVAQMQGAQQAAQQDAERERLGLVKKDPSLATKYGQARDAESFRELAKAEIAFAPAERAVKTLERLSKKSVLGPQDEALFERARTMYAGWLKGNYALQLGVLSESDKGFMDPAVPTRTAWNLFTDRADVVTKAMKDDFDASKEALKAYTNRTQ